MRKLAFKLYLGVLFLIQKYRIEPIIIKGKDFELVIPGYDRKNKCSILPDSWKDWEY